MRKYIIKEKPTALFCSDLHIRLLAPKCREQEEFEGSMFRKLEQINKWCVQYNVPLIIVGDLGHKPRWPNILISKMLPIFHSFHWKRIVIPGQHDLVEHRLNKWFIGALGVLHGIRAIDVVIDREEQLDTWNGQTITYSACPYGETPLNIDKGNNIPNVLLMHKLIIHDEDEQYKGKEAKTARSILNKYDGYDLIVTGDNHEAFTERRKGRLLVNCGSMMRTRTDQINHRPRCYLWTAKDNEVYPLYLPIKKNVVKINRSNINRKKKIKQYMDKLSEQFDASLSFNENIRQFFLNNKTKQKVENKVRRYMDEHERSN